MALDGSEVQRMADLPDGDFSTCAVARRSPSALAACRFDRRIAFASSRAESGHTGGGQYGLPSLRV
jgi:hypothetical protein